MRPSSPETPSAPSAEDRCHFATAVRFGRRRTDQVGQVYFTSTELTFRGTIDLHRSWNEVSHVEHSGARLLVALRDASRVLCFWCPSGDEARRGALIGAHLVALAQSEPHAQT